jgi:acetyl esterase/lipase
MSSGRCRYIPAFSTLAAAVLLLATVGCPPAGIDDVPDDVPNGVPDGVPDDLPDDVPDDLPDDVPDDTPDDQPDEPPGLTAPGQPASGPGGSQYPHQAVRTTRLGQGAEAFFLYEPSNPTPASAPVIAFLHGYGGINPRVYGGWIEHLVRRGNIVVFPIYQTTLINSAAYSASAVAVMQDAYGVLDGSDHVAADQDLFALVGHSLGATVAANIAGRALGAGLPAPRAIMLANGGDADSVIQSVPSVLDQDLAGIPGDVLMLAVVGNDDLLVNEDDALRIFNRAQQVPVANKEIVKLFSDVRGEPPLVAGHNAPLAFDAAFDSGESLLASGEPNDLTAPANAMDFYGYWKFLDGLTDAAFHGINREFAMGGTQQQLFMGTWSDGMPVRPAQVVFP